MTLNILPRTILRLTRSKSVRTLRLVMSSNCEKQFFLPSAFICWKKKRFLQVTGGFEGCCCSRIEPADGAATPKNLLCTVDTEIEIWGNKMRHNLVLVYLWFKHTVFMIRYLYRSLWGHGQRQNFENSKWTCPSGKSFSLLSSDCSLWSVILHPYKFRLILLMCSGFPQILENISSLYIHKWKITSVEI